MAGITPYGMKAMLDYTLGGAAEAAIAAWSIGLATSTAPTTASMYEIATGEGANRQTLSMGAAASPAGSASNVGTISYGPFSNARTISGISIWDTAALTGGNALWFGTLSAARTLAIGDSLLINPGSLLITLA
jgi:hypothetical protein